MCRSSVFRNRCVQEQVCAGTGYEEPGVCRNRFAGASVCRNGMCRSRCVYEQVCAGAGVCRSVCVQEQVV